MRNKLYIIIIVGVLVASAASSSLTWQLTKPDPIKKPTKSDLIADFYDVQNATSVSPHGLRVAMDKGDLGATLVDLRSAQEYEAEHITGAINIPAYKDPDTSAYDDIDRIVSEFQKLPTNKDIIVYCYSAACMTGRKIGKIVADEGVYVKHLNIGWNEWRYDWNSWNHPHEWAITKAEDYITKGKEAGKPVQRVAPLTCSPSEELGC